MAKAVRNFVCQNCGAVTNRWQGKCESCGEWNTIVEEAAREALPKGGYPDMGQGRIADELP